MYDPPPLFPRPFPLQKKRKVVWSLNSALSWARANAIPDNTKTVMSRNASHEVFSQQHSILQLWSRSSNVQFCFLRVRTNKIHIGNLIHIWTFLTSMFFLRKHFSQPPFLCVKRWINSHSLVFETNCFF